MGVFRFVLASLVITSHTMYEAHLPVASGAVAVRLFFIVSGFYMALILSEKYVLGQPSRLWLFFSNRAMRIYPLLWLAILSEVGLAFLLHHCCDLPEPHWLSVMDQLLQGGHYRLVSVYVATQLSGLGVDCAFLMSLSPDLVPHLYPGKLAGFLRGWQPYPLAHAWSISCEMFFYLAAPVLTRLRTSRLWTWLAFILVVSYVRSWILPPPVATVAGSFLSVFQFGYFILGILSYRLFKSPQFALPSRPAALQLFVLAALALCLAFYHPLVTISYTLAHALLYGLAVVAIPILFQLSAMSKWDRTLGDLSYPVYLVHVSVTTALATTQCKELLGPGFHGSIYHALTTLIVSCLVSWALLRLVDRPINRWRQARVTAA